MPAGRCPVNSVAAAGVEVQERADFQTTFNQPELADRDPEKEGVPLVEILFLASSDGRKECTGTAAVVRHVLPDLQKRATVF